jgi:hypothetical protein
VVPTLDLEKRSSIFLSTSQVEFMQERRWGLAETRPEPQRMVEDRRDEYGDPKSPPGIDRVW